jgi:hypothetical protein
MAGNGDSGTAVLSTASHGSRALERDYLATQNSGPQNGEATVLPEILDKLEGEKPWAKIFKWNFFRTVLSHICLSSLIGGAIIMALSEDIDYLDALFLAASAVTGTGFAVVSMLSVHQKGFVVIFILMIAGNGMVIQMAALLFRM